MIIYRIVSCKENGLVYLLCVNGGMVKLIGVIEMMPYCILLVFVEGYLPESNPINKKHGAAHMLRRTVYIRT